MDRRVQMQFNLQQTVERLSVVVITYYVLSLCRYLLEAANSFNLGLDNAVSIVLLMPVILAVVWLLSRRLKKRLNRLE